jgi:hypothetical protein
MGIGASRATGVLGSVSDGESEASPLSYEDKTVVQGMNCFEKDLTSLRAALPEASRRIAGEAHALITPAIVFSFARLAEACRRFESDILDELDAADSGRAVAEEINRALARLSEAHAIPGLRSREPVL